MSISENTLQRTIVQTFKEFYSPLLIETSLNGISLKGLSPDKKGIIIADAYKQGMLKGSSDLKVYLTNMKVLHIELKRPSVKEGKGQSLDQKQLQRALEAIGHKYYLCNSSQCFFKAVNANLDLEYRLKLFKAYKGKYNKDMVMKQLDLKEEQCM